MTTTTTQAVTETITQIALDELHESPFNPRKTFADVDELATNILAEGRIHQPLLVRPRITNPRRDDLHDGFEIVFGPCVRSEPVRTADMLRTCEDGCNGCDECTDWDEPAADDDPDAPSEFGCCLPPGECCMPGLHFPSECHTAADYERAQFGGWATHPTRNA